MMKVLLISTNNETLPLPVAPIGVAYLAGTLRANGFAVDVLDLCFEKNHPKATVTQIRKSKPDIIGLSLRNLDNSTAFGTKSYIYKLKELTDIIKAYSSAVIVIGGSGFSSSPEPLLEYLDLQYGIIGEGEHALLKFAQCIENNKEPVAIPGLLTRKNNNIKKNIAESFSKLDNLVEPAWDLINYKKYLNHGGYCPIQTKRGCMFKCIYCSYPVIEGTRYRLRSPEKVVDEIEKLHKEYGINYFFFVDSVFSYPIHHAQAICEEIISRNLEISWEAMTNPRDITKQLVEKMKQSGCIGVELGIDTASDKMLYQMGKNFSKADISNAIELYNLYEIPCSVYLLLGGPEESAETVEETVNFLDQQEKPNQVLMNFGIRIYANTPLAALCQREGLISSEKELLEPKVYISKQLGSNFFDVLNKYCRSRLHWSNATDWNSPISSMMMKLAQLLKLRPFWKHASLLGIIRKFKFK